MGVHAGLSLLGPSVDDFDPRRRLASCTQDITRQKWRPLAFQALSGSSNLRPGQHLVSTEIPAFVAMYLFKYDITPLQRR